MFRSMLSAAVLGLLPAGFVAAQTPAAPEIRLRVAHFGPHCNFLPPVFNAAGAAGDKFAVFDDAVVRPNAIRTAKIRNAGFSRNARAGKSDDPR